MSALCLRAENAIPREPNLQDGLSRIFSVTPLQNASRESQNWAGLGQRPAFWWNTEISELRNSCRKQRRKAQRARKSKLSEQEDEEDKYKDTRKLLRNAIKLSKMQCWKALYTDVDRDPWGTPYYLVIRKLQASRGTVAPSDVPTVFKIVEVLFPEGAPRESYPCDVAFEVPMFQMSELKLAAKRLDSGKALGLDGIPNEVL